jgi:hypothetical protein
VQKGGNGINILVDATNASAGIAAVRQAFSQYVFVTVMIAAYCACLASRFTHGNLGKNH